jgi:hypothetical protein
VYLRRPNGYELSGRGLPHLLLTEASLSYNLACNFCRIPGPLQRMVRWNPDYS